MIRGLGRLLDCVVRGIAMRGTLFVTILNVKSSYVRNVEEPVGDQASIPDTLLWWISAGAACPVKT